MYLTIQKTRLGMRIRAAASNPDMAQSLGLDIRWIHALVFAAGVALAAFAGMIAAPVSSVFPGMGNQVLIICFVVVVIGGIGSLKGALVAALLIGFCRYVRQGAVPGIRRRRRLPVDGGRSCCSGRAGLFGRA